MRITDEVTPAGPETVGLAWPHRLLTLGGLVVLTLVAGLQPWLPVEDAGRPAGGLRIDAAADVDTLHEAGRCGPTVTAIVAHVEAPDGVTAVRLSASKDGRRFTKGMVPSEDGYTSSLGPFEGAGPVLYLVSVTDQRGRTLSSAPGRLDVRACP